MHRDHGTIPKGFWQACQAVSDCFNRSLLIETILPLKAVYINSVQWYISNMNNIILTLTHPSTYLEFAPVLSAEKSAELGHKYQVFTVDASALCDGMCRPLMMQIYADAYDAGFFLQSDRTGACELFFLAETKYSDDHEDLQLWIFRPVNSDLNMEIVVYND